MKKIHVRLETQKDILMNMKLTWIVNPIEEVYDEEMEGPGLSWKGISEKLLLPNP